MAYAQTQLMKAFELWLLAEMVAQGLLVCIKVPKLTRVAKIEFCYWAVHYYTRQTYR